MYEIQMIFFFFVAIILMSICLSGTSYCYSYVSTEYTEFICSVNKKISLSRDNLYWKNKSQNT